MPNLGDYLGQMIAELARARMHGDAEAVRIADQFAGHALLRSFSVPRFRMLNVQLDIPVAVRPADAPPGPVQAREKKATKRVAAVLRAELKKGAVRLEAADKARLETALQQRATTFERAGVLPASVTETVDDLTSTLRKELAAASKLGPAEQQAIVGRFEASVRRELLERQQQAAGVEVVVATAELREIAAPELLTRLKLTLAEEGMEWKQVGAEGGSGVRLRPE